MGAAVGWRAARPSRVGGNRRTVASETGSTYGSSPRAWRLPSMPAARLSYATPSRFRWTGPIPRPTPPFGVWTPSTRCVRAFGPRQTPACAPRIRVTLQRGNFRRLPAFIDLAKDLGARQVSFLAVDVANPHAFGRSDDFASDLALQPEDLPVFEQILSSVERDHPEDFRSGFIAESPQKLRRIHQYFAALQGQRRYPPVRCNAPEFSAVIGATGRVQPCFFISGPPEAQLPTTSGDANLWDALNGDGMAALRARIRAGMRAECKTCVCSMWRDPEPTDTRTAFEFSA